MRTNLNRLGATSLRGGAAACLALLLTACGGGDEAARSVPLQARNSPGTSAVAVPASTVGAGADTGERGGRRRALADKLGDFEIQDIVAFDEAQAAYPQLFGHFGPTQTYGRYTYRVDPVTNNYLALTDTEIVLMGPVVNSPTVPVVYASLASFCAAPETARFCGHTERRVLQVGGLQREYIVYVPWKSRTATNVPVVFMLHGTSGDGEQFYAHSGWREKADETGLIAVFPSALWHCYYEDDDRSGSFDPVAERKVFTKWAAGKLGEPTERPLCTAAQMAGLSAEKRALVDHPLADDMAFIRQIVADLGANFGIDRKRLYVSGFSNGAEMSGRLAAEAADLFAAVACASSAVSVDTVASRPLSVIWSVGELDPEQSVALGYANGMIPLTADLGTNPRFQNRIELPYTHMLNLDRTKTHSQLTAWGSLISHFAYTTSLAGAGNTFNGYVIQGLAHEYPNGKNHPVRMADALWEFFRTQALP